MVYEIIVAFSTYNVLLDVIQKGLWRGSIKMFTKLDGTHGYSL
jgi:hypothetical protein